VALSDDDVSTLMSRIQAAQYLGVSVTTVDRMIRDSEIDMVRIRGAIRVTRASLLAYLNRSARTSKAQRRTRKEAS
jgi:excisionase family DNA binding protein